MAAPREPIKDNPGYWKRGSRVGFYYRDPNGHRRQATAETLTEAKALRAELDTDVRRGDYREQSKITLAAYLPQWIEGYRGRRTAKVKPYTLTEYERLLRQHVVPVLGQTMLAALEPRDVKALVNRLEKKNLAPGTIRNAITALKAMLATAKEEGLIRSNPASDVRLPARTEEARPKHLEPEQLDALFSHVPDEWSLFVRVIAYTGARIGEFTELRWKDLDLTTEPATLSISRRRHRGLVDTPKTKYGVRRLPLTPDLKKALAAHRLATPWSKDDDTIFATRHHGTPYDGADLLRRILKPAALAAGLVDEEGKLWPGWHTLRHTCGTNLARAGRRPEEIATWLGHHAASFSLDTYVGRPSATKIEGVDLLATSDGAVTT